MDSQKIISEEFSRNKYFKFAPRKPYFVLNRNCLFDNEDFREKIQLVNKAIGIKIPQTIKKFQKMRLLSFAKNR